MIRTPTRNKYRAGGYFLPVCIKAPPQRQNSLSTLGSLILISLLLILILVLPLEQHNYSSEQVLMLAPYVYKSNSTSDPHSLIQTTDGGFAISGVINLYNISCGHRLWLVKTDLNGRIEWHRSFGRTLCTRTPLSRMCDTHSVVIQTTDGGYALACDFNSSSNYGIDFWLLKTDFNGQPEWNTTVGGSNDERFFSLIQTEDGGYALAGDTQSFGVGKKDFFLVKLGPTGRLEWNTSFGGSFDETASSLIQTLDGGYLLAGQKATTDVGNYDGWLVKTDQYGLYEWDLSMEGIECAYSLIQTLEGNYVFLARESNYSPGWYFMRVDREGHNVWDLPIPGVADSSLVSIIQTTNTGYAITGTYTWHDLFLLKTNSVGYIEWTRTYEKAQRDIASDLIKTTDDGYALLGWTEEWSRMWLLKTDSHGVAQWNRTVGNYEEYYTYLSSQSSSFPELNLFGFVFWGILIFTLIYQNRRKRM